MSAESAKQQSKLLKNKRRARRRIAMLSQVADRTKSLSSMVKNYQERIATMQKSLEEGYSKIADLTKENVALKKTQESGESTKTDA